MHDVEVFLKPLQAFGTYPATENDFLFAYQLKKIAYKKYIEQTWGWDEEFQINFHNENFSTANTKIITIENKPVGTIDVREEDERIFISGLYLLPEYQSKGIGSSILVDIATRAKTKGKRLELEVLRVNVRAQELYKRLEFVMVEAEENKYIVFKDFSKKPEMEKIEIIDYQPKYNQIFATLNKAWLNKYFKVEPIDEKIFANPQEYIIDNGGYIFFAKVDNEIAGTFALIKVEETVYELSKMAVNEKFQGKGIGNKIIAFSLDEAKKLGAQKVILYSNTALQPAIHLYRKFGFQEVPLGDVDYERANIKMEIAIQYVVNNQTEKG
jgi:ribosomal protein S18 acetylase RimI-like enzyme